MNLNQVSLKKFKLKENIYICPDLIVVFSFVRVREHGLNCCVDYFQFYFFLKRKTIGDLLVILKKIFGFRLKKINKSPNGNGAFLLRILIVCPRDPYYPYLGKHKGEERMSIEIAKKRKGRILYDSTQCFKIYIEYSAQTRDFLYFKY